MLNKEEILKTASFNPRVKTYIFLVVLFYLITSIIGIVLIPFWLLGLGQWLSGKFFKTLSCTLTTKNLQFSKGLIIHIEKTIPLENIQDLSFYGGPLLRWLGLTLLRVETAGGGGGHKTNMMSIPGVKDAENLKIEILNQREKLIRLKNSSPATHASSGEQLNTALLMQIKEELVEIKQALKSVN